MITGDRLMHVVLLRMARVCNAGLEYVNMHDCRRSTYLPMSPAHLDHLPICLSSSADLRPCSQTASCKTKTKCLSFNMLTPLSTHQHSIVHSFLQHCSLIVATLSIHCQSYAGCAPDFSCIQCILSTPHNHVTQLA